MTLNGVEEIIGINGAETVSLFDFALLHLMHARINLLTAVRMPLK